MNRRHESDRMACRMEGLEPRLLLDGSDTWIDLELVATDSLVAPNGPRDAVTLPESISSAGVGDTVYLEVWVQEYHPDSDGTVGGSIDLNYTTDILDATGVTMTFEGGIFLDGPPVIEEADGRVEGFSHYRLSEGTGFETWTRMGYVELEVTGIGEATFSTAWDKAFGFVGGGKTTPEQIDHDTLALQIGFELNHVEVLEDAGQAQFTVTLPEALAEDVTVDWSTVDGSAVAGEDYVAAQDSFIIPAGSTSETFAVDLINDLAPEFPESFSLDVSFTTGGGNPVQVDITDAATITDDDTDPVGVVIDDATMIEGDESTSQMTFTVRLTREPGAAFEVDYQTQDGTANAGEDYTATSGTLSFAADETSKTVTVDILGDTNLENQADEAFKVVLSNLPGGAELLDGEAIGTIENDDVPPTLTIDSVTVTEGDRDGSNDPVVTAMTFTVSLSNAVDDDITVEYATQDDTATAGSDYEVASGTLTIPAGETSGTITVNVLGDLTAEGDETLNLVLSNPTDAELGETSTGVGTIRNDDAPIQVSVSADPASEGTDGSLVFTVTLGRETDQPFEFDYTTTDAGTAEAGVDFTAASGTLTIPAYQTTATFEVPVLDDEQLEGSETVAVEITDPDGADLASGTGEIRDDEGLILFEDDTYVRPANPDVNQSAGTVDFGTVPVGAEGRQIVLRLTNQSSAGVARTITGLANEPVHVEVSDVTGELARGETRAITITLKTETAGKFSETITLETAAGDTYSFKVAGTVVQAQQQSFRMRETLRVERSDGTWMTLDLVGDGEGSAWVTDDGQVLDVELTGTDGRSRLLIRSTFDAPAVGAIRADGSLAMIHALNVAVEGDVTVAGHVGRVFLGDLRGGTLSIGGTSSSTPVVMLLGRVTDGRIVSASPLQLLKLTSWTDQEDIPPVDYENYEIPADIQAPSLQVMVVTGNASMDMELTGEGVAAGRPTMNVARVIGTLSDADWDITGDARVIQMGNAAGFDLSAEAVLTLFSLGELGGTVDVASLNLLRGNDGIDAEVTSAGAVNVVLSLGDADGSLEAASFNVVKIIGDLNADLTAARGVNLVFATGEMNGTVEARNIGQLRGIGGLTGNVTTTGADSAGRSIVILNVGDVADEVLIDADSGAVHVAQVGTWTRGVLTARSITVLKAMGDFGADTLIGQYSDSTFQPGDLTTGLFRGDMSATLWANSANKIVVFGDMTGQEIRLFRTSGWALNLLNVLGWMSDSYLVSGASVRTILLGGSKSGTRIYAGVPADVNQAAQLPEFDQQEIAFRLTSATIGNLTVRGTQRENGFAVRQSLVAAQAIDVVNLRYPEFDDAESPLVFGANRYRRFLYTDTSNRRHNLLAETADGLSGGVFYDVEIV